MANYVAVPSWRMAWDLDGSALVFIDDLNVVTQKPSADLLVVNNEDNDSVNYYGQQQGGTVVVVFPELRDVDAYFWDGLQQTTRAVQVSTDTTNGLDGTWVSVSATLASNIPVAPNYRSQIQTSTQLAIKAIRFSTSVGAPSNGLNLRALHLYGEPSPGENPDRLEFWHPTLNQRVGQAYFDFGDVPRGTTTIKQFRIKNVSAAKQANTVRVAQNVATDATPSFLSQHQISQDGSSYGAQQTIGNLASGATSGILYLRQVVTTAAQLSVWTHRLIAEATSWT